MSEFPLSGISLLRMATDGEGVTALVCAQGCPLRCDMCINPHTLENRKVPYVSPEKLLEMVKPHSLYYIATGGGITFGGGEPLLRAAFIRDFTAICPPEWKINAETCLNVPEENVRIAAECVQHFFVDIKDMNPEIYRAYTGRDNEAVYGNLRLLIALVGSERVTVRVPLIPGFNTPEDNEYSEKLLRGMGYTRFDRFEYTDKRKGT